MRRARQRLQRARQVAPAGVAIFQWCAQVTSTSPEKALTNCIRFVYK
jgi:hypothetical protein